MQEQEQESQKKKDSYFMRVLFFSIISAIIIAGGVVWFLSAEGVIPSLWALFITVVLAVGGIIATVYFGIFPLSPIDLLPSKIKSIPLTSDNKTYSQNTNLATSLPNPTTATNQEQIAHDSGRTTFDEAKHLKRDGQLTSPDPVSYNTAAVRRLLTEALTDQDLETLCYDYFPSVYNRFTLGMDKQQKTQRLIEYCSQHNQFKKLIDLVKQINPEKYSEYENTLINSSQ